ncbi:MAG: haloacid dehalogenase [Desulfurococcales archaeon]|nr:haloacid dehalogenase [Desulfurococcales archaeon]
MANPLNIDVESIKRVIQDSVDSARKVLDELDQAREQLIRLSRDVIRESGRAIVEVHKGDLDAAVDHMRKCEEATMNLLSLARRYPQLLYTGLVNNAVSEYVEAKLFLALVTEGRLPSYEELASIGIPLVPYLQGLGDLVGELKRLALESVRKSDYETAWRLLGVAEAVYLELQTLDYPDALLPGVRRKADVARRIVDDLKAILVDLSKRDELARLLRLNLESLGGSG